MLFKRGKKGFYSFDFMFRGKRYQGSTHHTNKEQAAQWLRAFRTNLANTLVGLAIKEPPPTLSDFLSGVFTKHVTQQSRKESTLAHYLKKIKRLASAPAFEAKTIDKITDAEISAYKDWRKAQGNTPATINGDLAVLRKALRYADRGLNLIHYRGVSDMPGTRNRDFVLSGDLERQYLAVVPYPLRQVAILMLDLGLRPEEAVSLRKSAVNGRNVTVIAGKTANASRTLPQTQRTLEVFRFLSEVFPDSEWVFPGRQGKHLTAKGVSNLHGLTRKQFNEAWTAAQSPSAITQLNEASAVRCVDIKHMPASTHPWPEEFVLYSLRHTYGSRLAESGASNFEIKALMGHHSITISERYIHPSADHLTLTAKRAETYAKMLRGEIQIDTASLKAGLKHRAI